MNFLSSFPAELFQGCAREAYTAGQNAQVHRQQVWRAADSLSSPSRPASVRAKQASLPRSRRLNQTAGDSYTTVTSSAASTRRSSVGLNAQSLVNQAPRGLQPPSQPEPGA